MQRNSNHDCYEIGENEYFFTNMSSASESVIRGPILIKEHTLYD